MDEQEIVLRYLPHFFADVREPFRDGMFLIHIPESHFFADVREPFPIQLVGWSMLSESGPSPSFDRWIALPPGAAFVIEYAIYFDFDIQHLYDLEHVWVYVGAKGELVDAESSAHGSVVNCMRLADSPEDGTRLRLYLQPGKHAVLPQGNLAMLYPNYLDVCGSLAGKDGVLVPEMFREEIPVVAGADEVVAAYICEHYHFTPTLRYRAAPCGESAVVHMDELFEAIPLRVQAIMEEICGGCGAGK